MISFPEPSTFARYWPLDPRQVFLNHGSFGACPTPVLEKQAAYRKQLETQPVRFMMRELEEAFDHARNAAAQFIHADPAGLVFVANATAGVNTVFRSLTFRPGDEILITGHIYGACRKALEYVAARSGARIVEAQYGFPIHSPEEITQSVLAAVTPRTRIALVDHISSATGLIHPVREIVRELAERGVDTLVDGAHAIGSIPLDLEETGAAYYTANCHKWLCTPKGSAILHVREDRRKEIVPLVISHAGHLAEPFAERFYWPGTYDPSAVLCVPDAIEWLGSLLPGGWPELMERNRSLCLAARRMILSDLSLPEPCPEKMIGTLATFVLPAAGVPVSVNYKGIDPLQEALYTRYGIEIPVWSWQNPPATLIRIAVQLYNSEDQYRYLAEALKELLPTGSGR